MVCVSVCSSVAMRRLWRRRNTEHRDAYPASCGEGIVFFSLVVIAFLSIFSRCMFLYIALRFSRTTGAVIARSHSRCRGLQVAFLSKISLCVSFLVSRLFVRWFLLCILPYTAAYSVVCCCVCLLKKKLVVRGIRVAASAAGNLQYSIWAANQRRG